MDLFDYCNYESDSFPNSPPPDFRVQRTPWVRIVSCDYSGAARICLKGGKPLSVIIGEEKQKL